MLVASVFVLFPFRGYIFSVTWSLSLVLRIPEVNISYTNIKLEMKICTFNVRGRGWHSWLRHCATGQRVACSILDGVIGIFHWHNPSSCTMALGLTQPLTEMSIRNNFLGGKGSWCIGLTNLPHSCANCLEIWEPHSPGNLRACPGL